MSFAPHGLRAIVFRDLFSVLRLALLLALPRFAVKLCWRLERAPGPSKCSLILDSIFRLLEVSGIVLALFAQQQEGARASDKSRQWRNACLIHGYYACVTIS